MGSQLTFQDAPTRTSRLPSWPTKTLDDYGHVSVRHNNARRYPFIRRFVKSARSRVHHCFSSWRHAGLEVMQTLSTSGIFILTKTPFDGCLHHHGLASRQLAVSNKKRDHKGEQ